MDKTYVFENGGSDSNMMGLLSGLLGKSNMDPNLVAALMNGNNNRGGFGGEGCWFIWIILLFFMGGFGNNGFGNNANGALPTTLAGDTGREMLMNAIQGNGTAISQLAASLNTSTQNIQNAICGVNNTLTQIGGQIGMTGQQIINAVQMGNTQISQQIADCCCKTQNSITTMGYENQLATQGQTTTLVNTMNSNNQAVLARIDSLERTQLLDKIDKLREEKSTLITEVSQRNQNEYFASLINPISQRLGAIECRQLPTYPQSYMPGIPTTTFAAPMCSGAFSAGYYAGENQAV